MLNVHEILAFLPRFQQHVDQNLITYAREDVYGLQYSFQDINSVQILKPFLIHKLSRTIRACGHWKKRGKRAGKSNYSKPNYTTLPKGLRILIVNEH